MNKNVTCHRKKVFFSGEVVILIDEILEIEQLIERWQPLSDADTQWALYLLEQSLQHREATLIQRIKEINRKPPRNKGITAQTKSVTNSV